MKWSIAAFLIALTTASLAWAGKTDREKFEQFIDRVAPAELSKVKARCVCFQSGLERRAGWLVRSRFNNQVLIACEIPGFEADGSLTAGVACFDFDVIR